MINSHCSFSPNVDTTHQWVNGEHLLRTCLIGPVVPDPLSENLDDENEKEETQEGKEEEEIPTTFPAVDSPQRMKPPEVENGTNTQG